MKSMLREGFLSNALNYVVLYKLISRMIKPIKKTKAYELGIVDEKGKILRKRKTLKTKEEKDALTRLDIFVFNLKRVLGPLGRSKLANIVGALYLLKEQDNFEILEGEENRYVLIESRYSDFVESLTQEDYLFIEEISNVVGTGEHMAGLTGEPPVDPKKKKKKKKKAEKETIFVEGKTQEIPRRNIKALIGKAKSKIINRNITIRSIANEIEKTLRRKYDIEITIEKSGRVASGSILINAYYDPENDKTGDDVPIQIELKVSDPEVLLNLDNALWMKFSNELADAIQHEYLHMTQHRNRGFVKTSEYKPKVTKELKDFYSSRVYLGNSDEIEAYALNISSELLNKYRTKQKTIANVKRLDKSLFRASPNLFAYFMAFNFDSRHPVIRKLLKKVLLYIESQRPSRN